MYGYLRHFDAVYTPSLTFTSYISNILLEYLYAWTECQFCFIFSHTGNVSGQSIVKVLRVLRVFRPLKMMNKLKKLEVYLLYLPNIVLFPCLIAGRLSVEAGHPTKAIDVY